MLLVWTLAFALVLQDQELLAAADPESVLPGGWERAGWCKEQAALSERLDIIEEKVIKTVEYLESEVKSLLESVRETAQDIPVTPETPLGDIFDDVS